MPSPLLPLCNGASLEYKIVIHETHSLPSGPTAKSMDHNILTSIAGSFDNEKSKQTEAGDQEKLDDVPSTALEPFRSPAAVVGCLAIPAVTVDCHDGIDNE